MWCKIFGVGLKLLASESGFSEKRVNVEINTNRNVNAAL